jgi:AraC family transcriptional regulator, regulatory protein of adaptative response / methylated-DNA-[protein]-cysteine methyltransferase
MVAPTTPAPAPTDDDRWRAVIASERAADGTFVYAVLSTKVYCRPSCGALRPRRDRVVFYATPAEAEAAEFRACLRCAPDGAARPDAALALAERVRRLIEEREGAVTLAELAAETGVGPYQQRTFRRVTGVTPRRYADDLRARRLRSGLRNGAGVAAAAYDAGYGSNRALYEDAPRRLGMAPASYGRGGAGARIAYALADTPLGRLLVGATERGVCAVYLGGDDDALAAELRHEYHAAEITPDGGTLSAWVAAVCARLGGSQPHPELPLDVRATAFQARVWEELQRIPAGETRTYGEIAERIGAPGAARAVGRACATNPVSVVVPCHRAVGGSGELAGYRWGVERKRALLAREREDAHPPEVRDR